VVFVCSQTFLMTTTATCNGIRVASSFVMIDCCKT
jgi:hypothetical protein